jgi:hypothetical protein
MIYMANSTPFRIAAFVLLISISLLIAGCAMADNNGGSGNSTLGAAKGRAIVKVLEVVSGCGIEPPDGDLSGCGVHSATPYLGQISVSAINISGISLSDATEQELSSRTVVLGTMQPNASGEFEIELPAGQYMLALMGGNTGINIGPITMENGKTTNVIANFTMQVPGTRP